MKKSFLFISIVVSIGLSACSRDEEPEAQVYQQQPPTQPVQQQPVYVEEQGSNGTDVLVGMAAGAAVGSMLANNSRPTDVHHYHERTVVQQAPQERYSTYPSTKPIQVKAAIAPAQTAAPVKPTSPVPNTTDKSVTQTYTASTTPTKSTAYSSTSKSYGSSLSSGSSSSYKPSSSSYSSSSSYRSSSSTSYSSSRR